MGTTYYFVCFVLSLLLLLWTVTSDETLKTGTILWVLVSVIGNGGYYALANSHNLEKAVLANNLTYVIGIFGPMLFFFAICEICRIKLPTLLVTALYALQVFLYLCVLTIGKTDLFYKTVEFHMESRGGYLTKTYGPMHTVYLATMIIYWSCSLIVSFYYSTKKNIVSIRSVYMLIFVSFLMVGTYFVERLIHLKVELVPFIYTIGIAIDLFLLFKLSLYSIEKNPQLTNDYLSTTGYIVFTNGLLYMGCNRCAKEIFPELAEWELERKIPGNGGRFNTFLRQAFLKYVDSDAQSPEKLKMFTIKGKSYGGELSRLYRGKRSIGYVIKIVDVTDYQAKEK